MRTPASAAIFLLALGASSARAAETFGDATYYVGDLHAHTGYSGDAGSADLGDCEGSCGNFSEVFDTARANGLDFLAITDHVNGGSAMSAAEWAALNATVVDASDPENGFITLPAAEVWFTLRSTGARLGHKTLLFFGDDATVAGITLADTRPAGSGSAIHGCEDIWAWMDRISPTFGGAFLLPHHPAVRMPMWNDWACHDPTYEPAVEVYSEHGNSLADDGYDTPGEGVYTAYTVHSALDPDAYGLTFGFVGGTDSHDTRPGGVCEIDSEQPTHLYAGGLTVAVMDPGETFDRPAIRDAIAERRTYVTTGPALPVHLAWSAGGYALGGIGADLEAPAGLDLDATVTVPLDRAAHVTAVEIVGPDARWGLLDDGAGVWTGAVPAGETPSWVYVAVQIDGASWYGAEGGCDDGGDATEWIWTSPSPVALFEDDLDGDGVSGWTKEDCDDTDAAVYPGAPETWYDGVDQDCAHDDDFDVDLDGARYGAGDCDDTDPDVFPGARERWYDGADQDCDGADDFDQDRDGARHADFGGGDCDDLDASFGPDRPEVWYDGLDQDCSGGDDFDQDADGFRPPDHGGDDCDDLDPASFPGAPEVPYDGIDQACDGGSDNDADRDGFDARDRGGDDCDDSRPEVNPRAEEIWYDGQDGDCDGASDFDADADGFDAALHGGDDCDDTEPAVC
ncbi:MAG: MopE-related protein, partial [Myxococcota bacterium]